MKKTITTISLAIVMTFSATFANAGILVTDRANNVGILVTDRSDSAAGILVTDLCSSSSRRSIVVTDIVGTVSSLVGILVTDLTGRNEGCVDTRTTQKTRGGVTNQSTGILVTD